MPKCKDCVHSEICASHLKAVRGIYGEVMSISGREVNHLGSALSEISITIGQICCDDCDHFQDRSSFVELPCLIKPRDKVWYILEGLSEVDLKEYAIKSGECAVGNEPDTVIEVGTLGFWVNQLITRNENCPFPDYCDFISWDEIGKSYFLSKEEAKQALKEREEN